MTHREKPNQKRAPSKLRRKDDRPYILMFPTGERIYTEEPKSDTEQTSESVPSDLGR